MRAGGYNTERTEVSHCLSSPFRLFRYFRLFDIFLRKLRFVIEGEFDQRVAAFEFELLAGVGAVVFDRAVADEQLGGDLLAGLVPGDQFEDAPLGRRQVVEAGFLFNQLGRARVTVDQE